MPLPRATIIVVGATAAVTGLQLAWPEVLRLLERTPDALPRREYWRLLTPLLVHSDGWRQIAFNFTTLSIGGVYAERVFGARLWLVLYFTAGLAGELAGYAWQPTGGGASVAGAGLLGGLAVWVLLRIRVPQAALGAGLVLCGAIVLTWMRDIHGPPMLIGACVVAWRRRAA